jgi:hypothetical protein
MVAPTPAAPVRTRRFIAPRWPVQPAETMMGRMSQDEQAPNSHPADARAEPEAAHPAPANPAGPRQGGTEPEAGGASVVQWGGDTRGDRRNAVSQLLAGLVGDRRLVGLAAGLGAVALFASLISEWQITAVDGPTLGSEQVGAPLLPAGVGDLGAWGGGYLAGLFVLVASLVLLLAGPPGGRVYARLVGLSTGGVLLALLLALMSHLHDDSRALGSFFSAQLEDDKYAITYGRGGYCAVAGVAAVSLAMFLAGRHLPTMTYPAPGAAPAGAAQAGAVPDGAEQVVDWPWRRPAGDVDDESPDVPFELTVGPTTPFTTLSDDRPETRTDGRDTRW